MELTTFGVALKYAINDTEWAIPRYIDQGLRWLDDAATAIEVAEPPPEEDADA